MSYYPPYKSSSNNVTKTDLKNITHVDVSSFGSKTNLAALKTEVDKIDVDKLKATPNDLAKLTNAVEHDVVKKTDYNTKVTSIEAQIAGLTKNTVDNLADITKLKAIDTNSFVTGTKFSTDTNALVDKIDGVEKKNKPDISGLATKTSLNDYLKTSTFNSKVTEVESKIKDPDILANTEVTKANTIRSYATKADLATEITAIKNDYVTNASLSSQLNDLKSQHIATEVTGIDNKTKKNSSDILALEDKLTQKGDTINENERELSIFRGFFFYLQKNHLVYECKVGSFIFNNKKISKWESTGVFNSSDYYSMNGIENTNKEMPILKNDERFYVYLQGNHFQQNNVLTSNNDHVINKNVVNIYIVYKLDLLASTRDKSFTIQNDLFGAMQITKNATDNSKNNYKGYGICFAERSEFGHTITEGGYAHTTDARNVLIFGADMSSSIHATNGANHIYLMGTGLTQGINDTTIYAENNFYRNFTDFGKNFVLSLYYNGDNSYLFVNGRQELKFKAKKDQLVKEKLCIGNLSDHGLRADQKKLEYMEGFIIL